MTEQPTRRLRVVIGALTAARFDARRAGVMATWGRDAVAHPDVDLVFLVGDPGLKLPRRDGSALYLPCPDDYHSLPQKTRWFCLWALAETDAPWLLKCDDDTYIHIERLLKAIENGTWSQPVIGCQDGNGDHWHGGAGYLIRRRAALSIAAYLEARTGLEDWRARDAVAAGEMWFQHDGRFCYDRSRMPLPGNDQITCHYCTPVRMRLIHDEHRQPAPDAPTAIPRVLHHIWLGGQPIPDTLKGYRDSWLRLHPTWQHKLWTDENIGPLVNQRQFDAAPTPAQKSHIARYEILHRDGGVYVDFDVECRRPLDDLLHGHSGFAGAEDDNTVGIAVLGTAPGDPLLARVIQALPHGFANGFDPPHQSGSWFFTPHLLADHSWRCLWWDKFNPIHYSGRIEAPVEAAYAVHHWAASWRRGDDARREC